MTNIPCNTIYFLEPFFEGYPSVVILNRLENELVSLECLDPELEHREYLNWLRNPKDLPFILSARADYSASDLRNYILEINNSVNSILFGIYDLALNLHIGNIKFHDISVQQKNAYVGFLIGDKSFRGKGIAKESFFLGANLLKDKFGITKFLLGVDSRNISAVKAYQKMGFKIVSEKPLIKSGGNDYRMEFNF